MIILFIEKANRYSNGEIPQHHFPDDVLVFIGSLVPGDIKGQIRKVRALLSFNDNVCMYKI